MLGTIAQIVSALFLGGILGGWAWLIIRRSRRLGPTAPLRGRVWFVDVFRQGGSMIRTCPLVLVLPLAAGLISFVASMPGNYFFLQKNPDLNAQVVVVGQVPGAFAGIIESLPRIMLYDFPRAASELAGAAFSLFVLPATASICFFVCAFALLRPRVEGGGEGLDAKKGKILGIASGAAAVVLAIIFVKTELMRIHLSSRFSWWLLLALPLLLVVGALVTAVIIPMVNTAAEGRKLQLSEVVREGRQHFVPLLLYGLIITGISTISNAWTMLFIALSVDYWGVDITWLFDAMLVVQFILLATLSFVPVIIVIRRVPVISAFRHCIDLWAAHGKNALAFVVIGALLLLIPMVVQMRIHWFAPHLGWSRYIAAFLFSSIKAAIGVLVLCSMVEFCRRVEESEEEPPPE